MVKPSHVGLADRILKELERFGARIHTRHIESVPRNVIQEHYAEHKEKSFFGYMTESFVGKAIVIAVYEGEGVVQKCSDAIGATDPAKATADSIRARYSRDSLMQAINEKRPVQNAIHRSDSSKEAEREINVWKQYL